MRRMMRVIGVFLFVLLSVTACAHGRYDAFEALSPAAKAQYAKYRQFMTGHQRDRYLLLKTDAERDAFIADLHVEAHLAKWPKYVQDAIWAQEVVPGMDAEAVILSVGPPDEVLRDDAAGLDRRTWLYHVSGREVRFVEGKVVEVRP